MDGATRAAAASVALALGLLCTDARAGNATRDLDRDDLRALGVETAPKAWPNGLAQSFEVCGCRGTDVHDSVVAVLATGRSFDELSGEQRARVLRVFEIGQDGPRLLRESLLGDPAPHVSLRAVAELDGDEGAEIVLVLGEGGRSGASVEVFDPVDGPENPSATHSDDDVDLADVDSDGRAELVVSRAITVRSSQRCSAERVYLAEVFAYRDGELRPFAGAMEFYRSELAQTEVELRRAAQDDSPYVREALEAKVATLRARIEQ